MRFTILVLFFFLWGGCDKNDLNSEKLLHIRTGIVYGFCQGLCDHEFTLTEEELTYLKKSNLSSVEQVECKLPLEREEWQKLEQLVDDRFFGLDSVYGCPNCADQGSGIFL